MGPSAPDFLSGYLPYVLRQADQTLSAPFYAVLAGYGVARSEWRVLAVLAEHGDLGVLDLAVAALSPQPTVTHALRRLEERGLIERTPGAADRRQRIVSITPTGAELTTALVHEARRLEADALVDATDVAAMVAQLHALTAAVAARLDTAPTDARTG